MGMFLNKKSDSLCDLKILVGPSIPISPPLILNETPSSIDAKTNCAHCQDPLNQPIWYLLEGLQGLKKVQILVALGENPRSKVTTS